MLNKFVKVVVMAAIAVSASANARTFVGEAAQVKQVFETPGGRALAEKLGIKISEGTLQAAQRDALIQKLNSNAQAKSIASDIFTAIQGKSATDANIASVSVVRNSNLAAVASSSAGSNLLARTARAAQKQEDVGGSCSLSLQIPRSVNDILVGVNSSSCGELTAAHIAVAVKDAEAALADGAGANDAQQVAEAMKSRGIVDAKAALNTLYVNNGKGTGQGCLIGSQRFVQQIRSM